MEKKFVLNKECVALLTKPPEERIRFLTQPRWLDYPAAVQILSLLTEAMDQPKRPRMQNYLLVGDSNNGKTTLIRRFAETHPRTEDADGNANVPVIIAESASANEKALYCSIISQFFAPVAPGAPVLSLKYQALRLMRECSVRMLIIDEIHALFSGGMVAQRQVMNTLKNLCNELGIPTVGVGTQDAVRILHSDPQYSSRFDIVELPRLPTDKRFQNLLRRFEANLPLAEPSRLYAGSTSKRLYRISGGNLGDLHRLIVACAKEAIITGKERIDDEIIQHNEWIRPTQGVRLRTL